jgi:pimeloyl-ACP methyl ester carboxylesterase
MRSDELTCPSLYVYSATDAITQPDGVDAVVAARRLTHPLGHAGIAALRIEEHSPHVSHLITHPAAYAGAVAALLRAAAAYAGSGAAGGPLTTTKVESGVVLH